MHDALKSATSVLSVLCLAACGASSDVEQHDRDAEQAALRWLALVDAGDYGASWDASATVFRLISKERWEAEASAIQGPLGNLISRERIAMKYTERPIQRFRLQRGEHVVVQYRTTYATRPVIETLAMEREDGRWLTAGIWLVRE